MVKGKVLSYLLICFISQNFAQIGTIGSPFTSVAQARGVTASGTYYFNLGGTTFDTFVDTNGWILVAIDFGGAVAANLPQGISLTTATRGILNPTCLSSLTGLASVRLSTSDGVINATTTNTTIIARVQSNTTLNQGTIDNAIYGTPWTGTGISFINSAGASCNTAAGITLNANVIHPCGNSTKAHWLPNNGVHTNLGSAPEVASSVSFNLWVLPAPAPGGSSANLNLWVKANAGLTPAIGTVTSWIDQTLNNVFSITGTPTATNNHVNYNPGVDFDGASRFNG
ncbi:MAG: hypothetical protein ACOVOV_12390, partial [Dolichospermum sp.]